MGEKPNVSRAALTRRAAELYIGESRVRNLEAQSDIEREAEQRALVALFNRGAARTPEPTVYHTTKRLH